METNYKNQVMDYLKKTAKHTFIKLNTASSTLPKDELSAAKLKANPDSFGSYFKVFITQDAFGKDVVTVLEDNKIRTIDVDWYVKYYKENAKNVITNTLFLNKNIRSVKTTKYVKSQVDEILQTIKK